MQSGPETIIQGDCLEVLARPNKVKGGTVNERGKGAA